jgi:hypothetical protein
MREAGGDEHAGSFSGIGSRKCARPPGTVMVAPRVGPRKAKGRAKGLPKARPRGHYKSREPVGARPSSMLKKPIAPVQSGQTSENAVWAKFAEFTFPDVG